MTPLRVDEQYKRYRKKCRYDPQLPKKTKRDIRTELEGTNSIQPHDLCRYIGLLLARTIAPNREKLAYHWKTTDEGRIPCGTFGSVLRRDRFMGISRNLQIHGQPQTERERFGKSWNCCK
ncbi:hypothetical protein JG687_00017395 [Phytophthora cactorum]|uniref:PiggyBac transposable element-derived protein domain-containing protein n=1 Tax=Phytophthora cactorum TaxID=29920 RepID=A0A8T1TN58_9STRA|nr:hypothetical protein JG687_00017395 [Phytophthora cactorum]